MALADAGGPGDGIEDEIRSLVAANTSLSLEETRLRDDADLFNAGMTSYESVTVMMALEEHFEIEFPDELIRRRTFETIAAMSEAVRSLLETPGSREDLPG